LLIRMRPEVRVLPGSPPALTSGNAGRHVGSPLVWRIRDEELLPDYRTWSSARRLRGRLFEGPVPRAARAKPGGRRSDGLRLLPGLPCLTVELISPVLSWFGATGGVSAPHRQRGPPMAPGGR
jgi:hypothetical protein